MNSDDELRKSINKNDPVRIISVTFFSTCLHFPWQPEELKNKNKQVSD